MRRPSLACALFSLFIACAPTTKAPPPAVGEAEVGEVAPSGGPSALQCLATGARFCDGERYYHCEGATLQMTDCSVYGGTCMHLEPAAAGQWRRRKSFVGCHAPALCPDDAPVSRCESESQVLDCVVGLMSRWNCPPGTRCVTQNTDDGSTAACLAITPVFHRE